MRQQESKTHCDREYKQGFRVGIDTFRDLQAQGDSGEYVIAAFGHEKETSPSFLVVDCAHSMPPSPSWTAFGGHMPELQAVACSVLMQPLLASACERNRLVHGQIKSLAWNCMQHVVADKRVYCHQALHFQSKLQNASYSMDVDDGSESDSDVCRDAADS